MNRGLRQAWRDSRGLIAGLDVPQPFALGPFIADLATSRGRPVELVPIDTVRLVPCGAVLVTDRADYICYPLRTTPIHQRHIIFHEVGHLLAGDVDRGGFDARPFAALVPSLSTELVQRVLGRTHYEEPSEQRAEMVATLLAQRAGSAPADVVPTADLGSGPARLVAMFDDVAAQRR